MFDKSFYHKMEEKKRAPATGLLAIKLSLSDLVHNVGSKFSCVSA